MHCDIPDLANVSLAVHLEDGCYATCFQMVCYLMLSYYLLSLMSFKLSKYFTCTLTTCSDHISQIQKQLLKRRNT